MGHHADPDRPTAAVVLLSLICGAWYSLSMQPINNMPPTEWPKVTVGGKPFLMRFTSASMLLLADWGVPVKNIGAWEESMRANGRGLAADAREAFSMLGIFDENGDWEPLVQHPAKTMAKLVGDEYSKIIGAYNTAMAKVVPPATQSPEPEAKSEGTQTEKVN